MGHNCSTRHVVLVTELKLSKDSKLFHSATIRLTGWYLLILMILSIIFSFIIYAITYNEVQLRLNRFQQTIQSSEYTKPYHGKGLPDLLFSGELNNTSNNLLKELIYVNILVLIAGGLLSYILARRNLEPIEMIHESQSRFTSDASHELRTPLATMKTEIEVALRDKKATPKELRETLSSNLEEVEKLSKLSEMLLKLSMLDNQQLEFKLVNFTKIIDSVIGDYKHVSNRIKFIGNKPIMVIGSEDALSSLVKILIDNALKYSPEESIVVVRVFRNLKYTLLDVKNTGAGIKPEKIKHIFDRFYRADDSRTHNKTKSFGLGLAIAKKIVDVHQGTISVQSIPNKETIFSVLIPLTKPKK